MRTRALVLLSVLLLGVRGGEAGFPQKLPVATREAINPGLGSCPPEVRRATPAESWASFLHLAQEGRYDLAAHLLDLTEVPQASQRETGQEVARKLSALLDTLGASRHAVRDESPEGPLVGGEPSNVVVALTFRHPHGSGEVWLRRTKDLSTGELAWLFTRQTVSSVPFWYRVVVEESQVVATEVNPGLGPVPPSVKRGNPRATVEGFLNHGRQGQFAEAAHYLDLSGFPPGEQPLVGRRLARRLMLVLTRTRAVEPHLLSNDEFGVPEQGVGEDEEVVAQLPVGARTVTLFLIRHHDPDLGTVWTFSPSTVASIDALYRAHGYGWLGDALPEWMFSVTWGGLQLWQWLGLVCLLLAATGVSKVMSSSLLRAARSAASRSRVSWDDQLVPALDGPLALVLWALVVAVGVQSLRLSGVARHLVERGWRILLLVGVGWVLFRLVDSVSCRLRERAARGDSVGLGLIPVVSKVFKVLIFVVVLLAVLDSVGVQVVGLLAGLGLGGLALAFAAQKTLENLFGAVAIAADRPFKVGDWVTIGNISGTVEDVGLRSTKIRPLDRSLVSIPNGVVVGEKIVNLGARDRFLYQTTLGLAYGTTAGQLTFVIDEIKRTLMAHRLVYQETMRVRFAGFGPSSLEVQVTAWILAKDYHEFTAVVEELNFAIMRIVEGAGTSFAFPTHTVYLARQRQVDHDMVREAERQVEERRARGELTVPEPPPQLRERLNPAKDSAP